MDDKIEENDKKQMDENRKTSVEEDNEEIDGKFNDNVITNFITEENYGELSVEEFHEEFILSLTEEMKFKDNLEDEEIKVILPPSEENLQEDVEKIQFSIKPSFSSAVTEESTEKQDEEKCGNVVISIVSSASSTTKASGDYNKVILEPDNPLLQKFQKALKEHLNRQIDLLKEEIFDYDLGIKKNSGIRDQLGLQVYENQQIVQKQQNILENCIKQLNSVSATRQKLENEVKRKRIDVKQEQNEYFQLKKEDKQLQNELESTNYLIQQMLKWETDLESDITIKQRISDKAKKDKQKLLQEKRYQDLLIYNLMTKIWELESELETMDLQLKVKEKEREEMAQTAALGNTNIEVLESEYKALMQSWNAVIIAIGNRDKVLNCVDTELRGLHEKYKTICSEIQQVKKLSKKEMEKNENLTMLKSRVITDIENVKKRLTEETNKKDALQGEILQIQGIIQQIERDIEGVELENQEKNNYLNTLSKQFDKLNVQKAIIEEDILKKLEDQITNDKATMHLRKIVGDLQLKNREMEINLANCENKNAVIQLEHSNQILTNQDMKKNVMEIEKQLKQLETEADNYDEELRKSMSEVNKKQREYDVLNNHLQKLIEKSDSKVVVSTDEIITTLEKNIDEMQEKNKDLQKFWLREQRNFLGFSQQRQEQIHMNNLMRKQIMIMEQKNLRINDELEALKKRDDRLLRSIHAIQSRLSVLADSLYKKKGIKTNLDKNNEVTQQDYVYKLHDSELEMLKIQADIEDIEEDKLNFSNELIELNRIALEWEKKFKLAKETKDNMKEERGSGGAVGNMKAEIHRMNVRYGHLKKAQDKLIHDLEHCVLRRDTILTVCEAREKRTKGGSDKTRINFNRKLDDTRNKIKQMENELETIKEKMENLNEQKNDINAKIKKAQFDIGVIKKQMIEFRNETEEKKLSVYNELTKGRKPFLVYRSDKCLTAKYKEQKDINDRLGNIIENLITDFPNHFHELTRVLNTLKLPIFVIFS